MLLSKTDCRQEALKRALILHAQHGSPTPPAETVLATAEKFNAFLTADLSPPPLPKAPEQPT